MGVCLYDNKVQGLMSGLSTVISLILESIRLKVLAKIRLILSTVLYSFTPRCHEKMAKNHSLRCWCAGNENNTFCRDMFSRMCQKVVPVCVTAVEVQHVTFRVSEARCYCENKRGSEEVRGTSSFSGIISLSYMFLHAFYFMLL